MSLRVPHGFLSRGLLLLLLSLGLLLPTPLGGAVPLVHAAPTTWTVTSTGDGTSTPCSISSACPTLRSALLAAQDGDTIDLSGLSGVLLTTSTLTVTTGVTISGPGASVLAVSGSGNHRVFSVTSAAPVTMQGFSVQDGNSATNGGGGGIFSSGTLTLAALTLSGNATIFGNGGGGIYSTGTLTITASTLSGNTATNGGGGGIFSRGSLTITASTLSGNTSTDYGGGIASTGTLTITTSTLSGNTATFGGGGGIGGGGTLTITDSTLSGNTATNDDGGGIYSDGLRVTATVTITASTLSGNTATNGGGGGIASDGSGGGRATVTLTASTLAGNTAGTEGGGIYSNGSGGTSLITATTTVLAGNTASTGGDCYLVAAPLVDQGGNLDDDGTCGFSPTNGSISGATSPGLGTLGNHGGPTQTINLLPTSQAIGLGVAAGCLANTQTDQRGVARPATGCDSGAFQAQLPLAPPAPLTGTVGAAYTSTTPISLTGGTAPITYTLVPDTLTGTGLSLDATTGIISGTPLAAGTIPLTITALDSVGDSGTLVTALSIGQASTTTTISSCTPTPVFGQGVTCTASVTPQGTGTPTGTVTFRIDDASTGTVLGSCTLVAGSCTSSPAYTSVSAAGHSIYAVYGGNTDFLGSTSLASPLTVTSASTTLVVDPASGTYGGTTTLTATLTAGTTPLSNTTITFSLNGTAVSPTATTDANGVAVLTGVSLAGIGAGSYPYSHASTGVQADFAGDTNDAASVGGNTLTVTSASTTLVVDPASGTYGGTTTLTATLTAGTTPLSNTTITFSLNGTAVSPTATTDANGVAVLTGVSLAGIGAGSYPYSHASTGVQADFAGDTNDAASVGGNTLTVNRLATRLQLAASPATLQVGQSLAVTATISPTTPSIPTGTVMFTLTTSLGTVLTQTAPLVGTLATTTFTNLPPAQTARLQASYSGNTNFLPSSGRLDGKLTQLGCAVRGQVVQRGVGSLSGQVTTPPSDDGVLVLQLDTIIDLSRVQVVACSPGGAVQTAELVGTVQAPSRRSRLGTSRLFPPGTVLTISLTTQGNGAASARVSGSNGRVVRLSMEAHSGYRLRIRAIAPQS